MGLHANVNQTPNVQLIKMRLRLTILALALWFALPALAQEPVSPAPQTTKADRAHQRAIESDKAMGEEFSKRIAKEVEFSEDKEKVARVERIGNEFADIANATSVEVTWGDKRLSPFDYTFHVIKGKDVNAFSVPGGYIYVYEGLVDFAETDDELASVIAHEVAHASLRHIPTMQQEQGKFDIMNLAAVLAAIWSKKDATNILIPVGVANQAVRSGWSVNAEKAADYAGVQYMRKSQYNMLGSLTFMERLGYQNRFNPEINWGIFESHPPTEERAQEMLMHLRAANVQMLRSATSTSLRAKNKIGDSGIELWFGSYKVHVFSGDDAQVRADRAVDRLNVFCDAIPALYELEVRNEHDVYGKNRSLFVVTADDASAQGKSVTECVDAVKNSLKSAVFDLSYRAWTARLKTSAS